MNDKPSSQVARLDDIERRGRDIPVREHLGIHAFGINAYTPGEDGTLMRHGFASPQNAVVSSRPMKPSAS
jgi:hypothetical protein